LYFVPGVVGQLVNCAWRPGGGGSSTAVFGVMGSILIYVLVHRKSAPRQYPVFAILGICGAVVMCFTRDGHGPGLLTGAALAALICWLSPQEQPNNALQATRADARAWAQTFGLERRDEMDAAILTSVALLVAGLALLSHYDVFARIFEAEMPLRDLGLFSEKEGLVWERVIVVAGLAVAMTGILRLLGLS
jgi:hypothetical protein